MDFKKSIVIAIAVLAIVGMFVYVLQRNRQDGLLEVSFGEAKVNMKFTGSSIELRKIFEETYKDASKKKEAMAILEAFFQIYERDNVKLIASYRDEDGNTEISKSIRKLLFELQGPFQRKYHTYYDITQPSVVDAINDLGYEHEVPRELRRLSHDATGIFEKKSIEVEIRVDAHHIIEDGNAVVCEGSGLHSRYLLLITPDYHLPKQVFASRSNICINTHNNKPSIEISHSDANKLFGDQMPANSKRAIMYIAPVGYQFIPQQGIM
jgi:hypothetical protein